MPTFCFNVEQRRDIVVRWSQQWRPAVAINDRPILGVHVAVPDRGLQWSTDDGVSLDILAPTDVPLVHTGDDVNENSIVARLTYANNGAPFTAIFMGDSGVARESELIDQGINGHATFLKDWSPRIRVRLFRGSGSVVQ